MKLEDSSSAPGEEENPPKKKRPKSKNKSNGQAKNIEVFETLDDLKAEFDAAESESESGEENDYETHYHLAIAYKEMGLMEDSIREFQNALAFVKIDDGTRRFFHCANLLGHCFIEKQMPNLALM